MGYPTRTEAVRHNRPGGRGQQPGVLGVGQGIYEKSDVPLHRVGDKLELWGGRIFHYASFETTSSAGDSSAGQLLAADTSANDLTIITEVEDNTNDSSNYDPAIGAKQVEIVCTAVKNQFEGGTLHITDGAGEGHTYLIKRNSATGEKLDSDDPALTGTDTAVFELYDELFVALTNATEIAVMGNVFANLIPAVYNGADPCAIGVAMVAMDVSEGEEYGWVQTWGPASVLTSAAALGKGDIVTLSATTGAVCVMSGYTEFIVGHALAVQTASGFAPIFLTLVP